MALRIQTALIGILLAAHVVACSDSERDPTESSGSVTGVGGGSGPLAGTGGKAGPGVTNGSGGGGEAGSSDAGGAAAGGAGGGELGIPFGPSGLWAGDTELETVGASSFDMSMDSASASSIVERLDAARKKGMKMVLAMTGGSHENYLTGGVFDFGKWKAKMATYDTPPIKEAVRAAVADGTIVGNSVMDEPNVSGQGDGNTWGPSGTMTKARVDEMCGIVKRMFPELAVGVAHGHATFEPDKSYRVCEFIVDQYSARMGDVRDYRDAGLALGKRDGHAILFSMNILNGGPQDRDGAWNCPEPATGGKGQYAPNCRMTADAVRDVGITLGVAGCAMTLWRYEDQFMSRPENQQAFADVAAELAKHRRTACVRTP